jgi:hypothetical protein
MENIATMYGILRKLDWEGVKTEVDYYSKYMWNCYPNAYCLTVTPEKTKDVAFDVVFNPVTGEIYEASVHDEWCKEYTRWINPEYFSAYYSECFERQVEPNVADPDTGTQFSNAVDIDEVWAELEGIFRDAGNAHSVRYKGGDDDGDDDDEEGESITLDMSNDELAAIALAAHYKDMKINDFINEAVRVKLTEMEEFGLIEPVLTTEGED